MRPDLRDPRLILLTLAAALLAATFLTPGLGMIRPGYDVLAIVDITGSMNVRDYVAAGKPTSRLEKVKSALSDLIAGLPCPSRVALGVFTERRPFLLFEPIDACAEFSPLEAAIAALDWRMAWEGDSRISAGLFRSIDMAREMKVDLLFFTDGQEAPPLPASGGPVFEGKPGETRGLIVGTGGYELSPIPKFDDRGRDVGFIAIDDVPHESRFGLPPEGAEQREGFNARNAPFGATAAVGVEHLSSVKEAYLRGLAETTGLAYIRLEEKVKLLDVYRGAGVARARAATLDIRPYLGAMAAACLFGVFSFVPFVERLARNRRIKRQGAKIQ
jgi:mxaL protein